MRSAPPLHLAGCVGILLWLVAAGADGAAAGGELQLASVNGEGWQADDVTLSWQWVSDGAATLDLQIGRVDVAAGGLRLDALKLRCPRLEILSNRVVCPHAEITVEARQLGRTAAVASFSYTIATGDWAVEVDGLEHCDGDVSMRLASASGGSRAAITTRDLAIDCLVRSWRDGWQSFGPRGTLSGEIGVVVSGAGVAADLELATEGFAFDAPDGRYAAEGLGLQLTASLRQAGGAWSGTVEAEMDAGALYGEPILLDSSDGSLVVAASGTLDEEGRLLLDRFAFSQGEAVAAEGMLTLDTAAPWPPLELAVDLQRGDLGQLYPTFVQPFLIGTVFDDLKPRGALTAQFGRVGGDWSVRADLADVALLDGRGRYALAGLDGVVAWGSRAAPASRLDWDGGHVLRLALGASEARFTTHGGHVELLAPLRQPLVDGALAIGQLTLDGLDGDAPVAELRVALEPLSLEALSIAFGWVPMAGTVGGEIPVLRLAERTLTVDGTLRVDAFDGAVLIDNLQVERALGPLPVLRADVVIDNLDLELLTRTFTIGRIDGRLGGRIDGLWLQDWRPVRFDAELVTPPDDRSRHRISQRAIDSLASLGGLGGLGGVLSRSALRFFDDFGYDRLGLRCRLRGAVCELDGVAPAPGGYYLVKGGGLPRIDVVGHQRRVDWAELIKRVQRAMETPTPEVR